MDESGRAAEVVGAGLVSSPVIREASCASGRFVCECRGRNGELKWSEEFDNLVTTVGKNDLLDKYLAGSTWTTGTVYMGLKGTGTAVAGDTMASHASWSQLDITANRGTVTFAAASGGSKATSAAVAHAITAAGPTTVAGVYLVVSGTNANANTTGVLYSAGDFAVSRSVVASDTLNVTYTASV